MMLDLTEKEAEYLVHLLFKADWTETDIAYGILRKLGYYKPEQGEGE